MIGRIARTGLFVALPLRFKLAWIGVDIARGKRTAAAAHGSILLGQMLMLRRSTQKRAPQARGRQAQSNRGMLSVVTRAAGSAARSVTMEGARSALGRNPKGRSGASRQTAQS